MSRHPLLSATLTILTMLGCGGDSTATELPQFDPDAVDITNAVFTSQDADCSEYEGSFFANVRDVGRNRPFTGQVEILQGSDACSLTSNSIPNHDFNMNGAFATNVSEVIETFSIDATPTFDAQPTALSLNYDNAIFLNGVKLDLLAAACYGVGGAPLGQERIGCNQPDTPWRYDPMATGNGFGTDANHAHTQPDGAYHYHGDPLAMYDLSGTTASGVIGFAADGFPIYGPYINDNGTVGRVESGFTLKPGARVSQAGEGAFPGGDYDGTFIDDWEWTDAGDLDACNGMEVAGVYGYYVTDSYPWLLACFRGSPDPSFRKGR